MGACPAASATRDVHYEYDLRGLQTKARFDHLGGEGVTTTYDGHGQVTSSTLAMAGTSRTLSHLYDGNGNRTRITHPDGSFFPYEYDGLGRFLRISENGGDTLAISIYDNAGRRSRSGWAAATDYTYDPVGRLQSMSHDMAGSSGDHVIGLTYNPASQIVTRSGSNDSYVFAGPAAGRRYTVNGLNQYTAAGPATFTYDSNGNLTSTASPDGTTSFVYDAENRLVSASGSHSASLVYDPLGRLFQVSGGPAGITQFLYDDDALIGEYDSAGGMPHRYLHGPAKGVDDPIIWYHNSAAGWRQALVSDQQGSIVAVADMYGNRIATNAYDEWGIPRTGNQGRFQYTGQAWIPELGMYHYKARMYSPTLGRFLQTDPIGYDDQVNLYAYVGNDPINRTDPTGMYQSDAERRALENARRVGVDRAWAAERRAVQEGRGSRAWTRAERAELLRDGRVKGYEGHHINTVKGNPIEMARDPRNIQFVTRREHVQIHRQAGGYRQPIVGRPLITRATGILSAITGFTGILSGRIRTDSMDNFFSDMAGTESRDDYIHRMRQACGNSNWKIGDGECA